MDGGAVKKINRDQCGKSTTRMRKMVMIVRHRFPIKKNNIIVHEMDGALHGGGDAGYRLNYLVTLFIGR